MQIFNIHINGDDAKWFCDLSKEAKIEWIKLNTNCQSDVLIEEFLNNPIKEDCGCGCGGNKQAKKNVNISERVSKEIEPSSKVTSTPRDGKRTTNKGRSDAKKP